MYRYVPPKAIVASACIGVLTLAVACSSQGPKSAAGPSATAPVAEPVISAPEPTLRLISQSQYINTISQIFGSDVAVKIRFAPVKRDDGLLAVGAGSAVLTSGGLDPLDATARAVAEQVVDPARRPFLIPCKPANVAARDDQCAREFLLQVGRLLYRRPLTDNESAQIVATAGRAVGPAGDFYAGLAYAVSRMLVSAQFLFIREIPEPDPRAPGSWRLDAYSKASRLSFLLWNSAPDDELLKAAEKGDLHQPARLRREVDRMLASPRYSEGVRAFFTDFFVLEAFDTLSKDPTIYPAFSLKAVDEAREQILRTVVDHLVARHGDYRDLYTTRRTFVTAELAVLYKLPVNIGIQGWVPYEFQANDPRAGILTQVGFLAQYAHPGRSSPTRRGRGIREVLLCEKVPDPPGNVDFSKFEDPTSAKTARERLTVHRENPVCAGCHALTDPIGLGFENFDGAGQYRPTENGAPIDASGKFDGMSFHDAVGLGEALRNNQALRSCIVNRIYAYSVGHKVTADEKPLLKYYGTVLDQRGYRFDEMLRLVVLDQSFFSVKPPNVTVASAHTPPAESSHAD
jgi:hypothetical protein